MFVLYFFVEKFRNGIGFIVLSLKIGYASNVENIRYFPYKPSIIIIEFIFINQIICSRQFFLQIKYFHSYRITIFSDSCESEQDLFKFSYSHNLPRYYFFFFSILSNTNSKFSSSNLIPNYLNLNKNLPISLFFRLTIVSKTLFQKSSA